MSINWDTKIRPLFREIDVEHMIVRGGFDLSNPAEVLDNSDHIIKRLKSGTMPPASAGGPWPAADITLLVQWIKENKVAP